MLTPYAIHTSLEYLCSCGAMNIREVSYIARLGVLECDYCGRKNAIKPIVGVDIVYQERGWTDKKPQQSPAQKEPEPVAPAQREFEGDVYRILAAYGYTKSQIRAALAKVEKTCITMESLVKRTLEEI